MSGAESLRRCTPHTRPQAGAYETNRHEAAALRPSGMTGDPGIPINIEGTECPTEAQVLFGDFVLLGKTSVMTCICHRSYIVLGLVCSAGYPCNERRKHHRYGE